MSVAVSHPNNHQHPSKKTQSSTHASYQGFLSSFPSGIVFAFAYGSAAFSQSPESMLENDKLMLDLIFVVNDTRTWHKENIALNPTHYSFLRVLGPSGLTFLQRSLKANIYFNVVLEIPKTIKSKSFKSGKTHQLFPVSSMKYGVIQLEDLIVDLKEWTCLYVAGRLHKPIQPLISPPHELDKMLLKNRISAVASSLLLLPNSFSELDLFVTIAGLSYMGDFRMIVGEDKSKVINIVTPQLQSMREMYHHLLMTIGGHVDDGHTTESIVFDQSSRMYHVTLSHRLVFHLVSCLPAHVVDKMGGFEKISLDPFMAGSTDIQSIKLTISEEVKRVLMSIVWASSLSQGIKGFFSTGFLKAIKYVRRKMFKMIQSLNYPNATPTIPTSNPSMSQGTMKTNNQLSNGKERDAKDKGLLPTASSIVNSFWSMLTDPRTTAEEAHA